MEFDIRYDKQGDQFLLFISQDDTYNLTGRIVAKRRSVNHDWQVFNGMNLIYREYVGIAHTEEVMKMRLDHRMIQDRGMGNKRMRTARIIDAIGGGLCPIHGEYLGHGRHGLRACPFCDIDEFFKQSPKQKED